MVRFTGRLVQSCYRNSLELARQNHIKTIAFPSISVGIYSFPVERAAQIAIQTVQQFIAENPQQFNLVMWVLVDEQTKRAYETELANK